VVIMSDLIAKGLLALLKDRTGVVIVDEQKAVIVRIGNTLQVLQLDDSEEYSRLQTGNRLFLDADDNVIFNTGGM
jgi:hypothetical protein